MLKSRNSRIKAKLDRILLLFTIISTSYFLIFLVFQEGVINNEEVLFDENLHLKEVPTPVMASDYTYSVDSIEINTWITINTSNSGNWAWAVNTFEWCSGNGTLDNPYKIENVYFDGGGSDHGLAILNSFDNYFEIRNCKSITSTEPGNAGIYLESNSNGTIINNNCSSNYYGILLNNSNFCTLSGNAVSYNWDGISLVDSDNCTLSGNIALYNRDGINLDYSDYCTLSDNNATYNRNAGIFLSDSDNSNLLGNIASYHGNYGIFLTYSDNCELSDNIALYNNGGILLLYSDICTLSGNNASYNNYGIFLYYSDICTLSGNTANNNTDSGINLNESNLNFISGNTLLGNGKCIKEENCQGNVFSDNGDCTYENQNKYSGIITGYNLIFLLGILSVGIIIISKKIKKT